MPKPVFIDNTKIKLRPSKRYAYNKDFKFRARSLRQAGNLPEILFWMRVTKGQFHGLDFDRQIVIGNYIVDLLIKHLHLIIEIDGNSHIGREQYDADRTLYLQSVGFTVYRIPVVRVMKDLNNVMQELEIYIVKHYGFVE
jgi:very-short-patch-repair endonuclease